MGKDLRTVKIEVKNCRSCCFNETKFLSAPYGDKKIVGQSTCLAPVEIHDSNYDVTSYYKYYKSPKFCPLKKQSLKIEFKK